MARALHQWQAMAEPVHEQPTVIARWVSDTESRPRARSTALLVGVLFVACVGTASAVGVISEPRPTLSATPNLPVERAVAIDGSTIVVAASPVRIARRNQSANRQISNP